MRTERLRSATAEPLIARKVTVRSNLDRVANRPQRLDMDWFSGRWARATDWERALSFVIGIVRSQLGGVEAEALAGHLGGCSSFEFDFSLGRFPCQIATVPDPRGSGYRCAAA